MDYGGTILIPRSAHGDPAALQSNIIRAIKSRRMGWMRHVAHMGRIQNFGRKLSSEEIICEILVYVEM